MTPDPNIGAGIGNVADDPNAGAPTDMPDSGMEDAEQPESNDDSTAAIIDQLSDDDKEAVRNYAKSLLNRDEEQPDNNMGDEETTPEPEQGQPQGDVMMEITKGRLEKIQKKLHEKFRDNDSDTKKIDVKQKKLNKNRGKKSPFDSPLD